MADLGAHTQHQPVQAVAETATVMPEQQVHPDRDFQVAKAEVMAQTVIQLAAAAAQVALEVRGVLRALVKLPQELGDQTEKQEMVVLD
jgi:hypothetical protein